MNADAALFAALEEPPGREEPMFWIEPKDKLAFSELQRQAAFVKQARALGYKVHAGRTERRWSQWEWNQAVKAGMWWGFADLLVFGDGGFLAITEWKSGTKMPEQHQVACLNTLHRLGHHVAVCRTAAGAIAWLEEVKR
jgi:hypothetical protein